MDKEMVYGMMYNALCQIADGVKPSELTVNPDMERYDDVSLDELMLLARKYL